MIKKLFLLAVLAPIFMPHASHGSTHDITPEMLQSARDNLKHVETKTEPIETTKPVGPYNITPEMLQSARDNLKHVETRTESTEPVVDSSRITPEMLQSARDNLKHVETIEHK